MVFFVTVGCIHVFDGEHNVSCMITLEQYALQADYSDAQKQESNNGLYIIIKMAAMVATIL